MSADRAEFDDTTIYAAEVKDTSGEVFHIIGYQNSAKSIEPGPNAMIIPLPAVGDVNRDNVIDTSDFKDVLERYGTTVGALGGDGMTKGSRRMTLSYSASRSADVFESGSYTVILATDPRQITEALERVPEEKRPSISKNMISFLSDKYDGWPVAVCCFSGSIKPEPLVWKFKPRFENVLFAPAMDSHTGGPPSFKKKVQRSHKLAFHSYRWGEENNMNVHLLGKIPDQHKWMFSKKIKGALIRNATDNGDFVIPIPSLVDGPNDIRKSIKITS